jgi:hypothetical protein
MNGSAHSTRKENDFVELTSETLRFIHCTRVLSKLYTTLSRKNWDNTKCAHPASKTSDRRELQ